METPNASPPSPTPNQTPAPMPWWQDRTKVTVVAAVGVIAVVLAVLLVVLNTRGGETAVASPTPTLTPSSSVTESGDPTSSASASASEPSASAEASTTPSASAQPTATPQAELPQGWARIDTNLNLRDGPGEEYAIVKRVKPHQVVWVNSGHERAAGDIDWYYVQTPDGYGTYGWIASGPADDPYATSISNRFVFQSCGPVAVVGDVGLINGLRTPYRLSEFQQAKFELAISTGTHGCLRLSNQNGDLSSRPHLEVHACGAPTWDGSVLRLQPTTAGNVDDAWRVDTTLVVPEAVLTEGQTTDNDGLTNPQKILILGGRMASPFGCIDDQQKLITDTSGCLVMVARGSERVVFAPAGGGESVTLLRGSNDHLADLTLNDPTHLRVWTTTGGVGSQILGDC